MENDSIVKMIFTILSHNRLIMEGGIKAWTNTMFCSIIDKVVKQGIHR